MYLIVLDFVHDLLVVDVRGGHIRILFLNYIKYFKLFEEHHNNIILFLIFWWG